MKKRILRKKKINWSVSVYDWGPLTVDRKTSVRGVNGQILKRAACGAQGHAAGKGGELGIQRPYMGVEAEFLPGPLGRSVNEEDKETQNRLSVLFTGGGKESLLGKKWGDSRRFASVSPL